MCPLSDPPRIVSTGRLPGKQPFEPRNLEPGPETGRKGHGCGSKKNGARVTRVLVFGSIYPSAQKGYVGEYAGFIWVVGSA